MSENVLPVYIFLSFMVSNLIFQSLSHFEFIFMHGLRVCSNFIDLHVAFQLSQHHLLKRIFFFPLCILASFCQRLTHHRCVGLFLGSLFCSINPYVCFVPISCYFDYCTFVVLSEVWDGYVSTFILFSQDCFGNLVKNVMGNLIGITFESMDCFG